MEDAILEWRKQNHFQFHPKYSISSNLFFLLKSFGINNIVGIFKNLLEAMKWNRMALKSNRHGLKLLSVIISYTSWGSLLNSYESYVLQV